MNRRVTSIDFVIAPAAHIDEIILVLGPGRVFRNAFCGGECSSGVRN